MKSVTLWRDSNGNYRRQTLRGLKEAEYSALPKAEFNNLIDLLKEARDTIEGLSEQQAMPNGWYIGTLTRINDCLKENCENPPATERQD